MADRAAISAHLAEVARCHPPFDMHLSGTGTFCAGVRRRVHRGARRASATASCSPPTSAAARWRAPLSFPYHPHVTVAHDVPADMLELAYSGLADLSAEFRVDSFTEFEQTPSGAWAVAREYPLTGPPR